MRIAVTGATGQLGQIVVNDLLEKGSSHEIVAVVRNKERAQSLVNHGAEVCLASYGDPYALEVAFSGVDKLLLISSSEIGQRIEQHKNVINAAKASGIKHIVYTSIPQASTTNLILAPEHKATEVNIRQSGLAYTLLRNNWYTENYANQVEMARQTGKVVAAVGIGRVASATRADFAAGATAVLLGSGHEGKVYELGGDYAWDYHELAQAIAIIIGKPVAYHPVDAGTLIDTLKGAGMDEGTAGFIAALDRNILEGALAEVTGELSRLIKRPTTSLVQGLKQAVSK